MMGTTSTTPAVIAHRGYALRYPENSLIGIRAAIEAGALFIEVDVQMSADGVPVLHHDASVERTAGVDGHIMNLDLAQLNELQFDEKNRLGPAAVRVPITTLEQFATLLCEYAEVTAFVEVKPESFDRFGVQTVVDRVMHELQHHREQVVIISFDQRCLRCVSAGARVGWILKGFDGDDRRRAQQLSPDYLFCNHELLPDPVAFWPGSWQWAVYEVDDVDMAIRLGRAGAHFVETMAVGEMLNHTKFAGRAERV